MPRLIGEAYVAIVADSAGFQAEAQSGVSRALAAVDARKAVDADTAPFLAKIEAAKKAILSGGPINILVGADIAPAEMEVQTLRYMTEELRLRLRDIPVSTDDTRFMGDMIAMNAALTAFDKNLKKIGRVDPGEAAPEAMMQQFLRYESQIKDMEIAMSHLDPKMNAMDAIDQLSKFRAMVEVTVEELAQLKLDPNDLNGQLKMQRMLNESMALAKELRGMTADMDAGPMRAKILSLTIEAAALQKELSGTSTPLGNLGLATAITQFEAADAEIKKLTTDLGHVSNSKPAVQAISNAVGEMATQAATFRAAGGIVTEADLARIQQLTAGLRQARAAFNQVSGAAAGGGGGGFGFFGAIANFMQNTHIPLFASQMTVASKDAGLLARGLTVLGANAITTASGFHILAEGVIETLAVWGPAVLGMALFGAAAVATIKQVTTQLQNSKVVAESNKTTFNGVAAGMSKISQAAQPKVLMLWGYYMDAAAHSSGHLASIVSAVGSVLDGFAQRMDNALSSKQGSTFLDKAAQDIQGLGDSFAQVGRIISTFISVMPGYAAMLLNIGDAALKAAADVTQFITPALRVGLALHGGVFYAGLASTILLTFGRSALSAAKGVMATGTAAEASGGKLSQWGTAVGNAAGGLAAGARGAVNWAKATGGAIKEAEGFTGKLGALSGAMNLAQWGPWALGIGLVAGALIFLAINASKASDKAMELRKNLQAAIDAANIASIQGTIADSVKQVTAAVDQNAAAITKLSAGIANHTANGKADVRALGDANRQYQENSATLQSFNQQFATSGVRLADLTNKYGGVTQALMLFNLAGVNQKDIAQANNAQWQADLQTLKVAASVYGFMGQSVGTLGAQLSALSISTGKTTGALQTLTAAEQQWINIATGGEAAFTAFAQGMQTLSGQIGVQQQQADQTIGKNGQLVTTYQNVTASLSGLNSVSLTARASFQSQIASAIALYGSLQSLNAAAGATPKSIATLNTAAHAIVGTFLDIAKTSPNATQQLYYLAQSLGYTGKATIKGLAAWAGYKANAAGATAATKALDSAQQQLTVDVGSLSSAAKNLGNALASNITASQAAAILSSAQFNTAQTNLVNTLVKTHNNVNKSAGATLAYYDALVKATGSTSTAKSLTDAFLGSLGLTKGEIDQVNKSLDQEAAKLNALHDKTVHINVVYTTSGPGAGAPYPGAGGTYTPFPKKAVGGIVKGGGSSGRDSVLTMLAPGELVIPTSHAPAFQVAAKRAGIPGLAMGGMPVPVGSFNPSALVTGGYVTAYGGGSTMQPQTSYQGQQLILLMQQVVRLLQQQPQQFGNVINQGNSNGVRSAYFTAHS